MTDLEGRGGNGRSQRAREAAFEISDEEAVWRAAFAANLREARGQRRFSQDVAKLAGVKQNTVSDLERAAINPSFGLLVRLARAVGVSVPALLDPRGDVSANCRTARPAPQGS